MKSFEKVSLIKNCTLEELFEFHLDISNLKEITPPDTKVKFLNKEFVPQEGNILDIETVKNFITTTWKVKIEKLEKPNILVDKALKSPFKYWEHKHIFLQKGNVCQLKDVVNYELPFGKLGEALDFFIRDELQKMFDFRHQVTKKILSNKKTTVL